MPNEDKEERKPLLQNEGRPSYNAGDYISGNDFMKLVLLVTNESYNMIGWLSYGCPSGMIGLWYRPSWLKYVVLFTYIQTLQKYTVKSLFHKHCTAKYGQ